MEELEQILSCSICMEIFKTPRQLPCQHSFCTQCIADIIAKKRRGSKKIRDIICPLCRATANIQKPTFDATGFPVNLTIQSILDAKELMKSLEESKEMTSGSRKSSTSSKDATTNTTEIDENGVSIFTSIRKFFNTSSKSTQTNNIKLRCQCGRKLPRLNLMDTIDEDKHRAKCLSKELFTFRKFDISCIFSWIIQKVLMCYVDRESTRFMKWCTALSLVFVYFCIIFKATHYIGNNSWVLFIIALLINQLFFGYKDNNRHFIPSLRGMYEMAAFTVSHLFTWAVCLLCYLLIAINVCNFTVLQTYAFQRRNETIWTPSGMKMQTVTIANNNIPTHLYIEHFVSALTDYNLYLEFYIHQVAQAFQMLSPFALPIFVVILIRDFFRDPPLLLKEIFHNRRRH